MACVEYISERFCFPCCMFSCFRNIIGLAFLVIVWDRLAFCAPVVLLRVKCA